MWKLSLPLLAVVSPAVCAGVAELWESNVAWMVAMEACHPYGLLGLCYCCTLTWEGGKVALSSIISLLPLMRGKDNTLR